VLAMMPSVVGFFMIESRSILKCMHACMYSYYICVFMSVYPCIHVFSRSIIVQAINHFCACII
jgi:hypothetical protein